MTEHRKDWSLQYCNDKVFVPASPQTVFDALLDISRWNDWWVTMRFETPVAGPLKAGDRIVFDGGVSRWTVEVEKVDAPHSIRLRYAEGDLIGATEWLLTEAQGGCQAAYIYHGVRACQDRAATTFGRFGTRLHTMVMQADALDGLVRLVTGQPLDEAWRQFVRDNVMAAREALTAETSA